ncbi:MAG: hypothetical protein WAW85_07900 [Gordonia sp. (in: high G+C Gram-positive bacteria)]|uniref:hypothetical protein n=1 Tax=Gordonia sp. (in: high G+C Gram-positive bacteria) TaxID=84139 RepID=UPI003BB4F9E9
MSDSHKVDALHPEGVDLDAFSDSSAAESPAREVVFGIPEDEYEFATQIRFELEALTSLLWSPDPTPVIHALVGDYSTRAGGDPTDRIPLAHPLFIHPGHAQIFAIVVDLIDQGAPVSPTIVAAQLPPQHHRLHPILVEIASPRGRGPLPGGVDLPHLARALADSYYRRGYVGLLARMTHIAEAEPTDELSGHWDSLSAAKDLAERRWHGVRDALSLPLTARRQGSPMHDQAEQTLEEDAAAMLRDAGRSWEHIAAELALPTSALARQYAHASDRRANARAHRDQPTLFEESPAPGVT